MSLFNVRTLQSFWWHARTYATLHQAVCACQQGVPELKYLTYRPCPSVQVKSPGDMRNFDVEKMKAPEDSGYKSTGVFADF